MSEKFHSFGIFSKTKKGGKEGSKKSQVLLRHRHFHYNDIIHTPDKPGKLKQPGEHIVHL